MLRLDWKALWVLPKGIRRFVDNRQVAELEDVVGVDYLFFFFITVTACIVLLGILLAVLVHFNLARESECIVDLEPEDLVLEGHRGL